MSFDSLPSLLTFDQFFDRYPRAIDRNAAKAAWDQVKPSLATQREIIDALIWQTKVWSNTSSQYIPTPSNYLLKERYRDKPPLHLRPKVAKQPVVSKPRDGELASLYMDIRNNRETYKKGLEFLPSAKKFLSKQTLDLIYDTPVETIVSEECPW